MARQDSKLTNQETMEKFLKTYKESRGVGSRHYADYIRTRGTDAEKLYTDAVSNAAKKYDRSLAGYGTMGEYLSRQGGAAGYASYLDQYARLRYDTDRADARETYDSALRENNAGYAAYLDETGEKLRRVVNSIRDEGLNKREDAYAYALTAGVDKENAALVADLVDGMEKPTPTIAERRIRVQVLTDIINLFLPRDAAYEYAISVGLDSDTAAGIADTADEILKRNEKYRY